MRTKFFPSLKIKIVSILLAAVDTAAAYFVLDIAWGQILTWPMLLLSCWILDSMYTPRMSRDFKEQREKRAKKIFDS